ncbi:ADP-ribosylglycohydrolase family protein [Oceanithermus sp.]
MKQQAWLTAKKSLVEEGWVLDVLDRPLDWPFEPKPVTISKVRGTLFGIAIGDALGAPNEGKPRWKLAASPIDSLRPHNGRPAGTVTDDTDLTLALARSILATGTLDPEDLVPRIIEASRNTVGGGWATEQAVNRLERRAAWWLAGTPSAGNGAAMRAAPVGLFFEDPAEIRRAAFLQAIITHRDRSAAASAIVNALFVSWLARGGGAKVEALEWLASAVDGLEVPLASRHQKRKHYTVAGLVREAASYVGEPGKAFERFRTGAFVLETLPSALVVFLSYPEDPEKALLTAAHAGDDTDTLASLVGGWLGAHLGDRKLRSRTPSNWWNVSVAAEIEKISRLGT